MRRWVTVGIKHFTARAFFRLAMAVRAGLAPVAFGVAGAILDDAGQVLLVRQSYLKGWRLPGGGVNRGEAPAMAVLRELREEVGLEGGVPELFALYTRRAGWVSNVIALYCIRGGTVNFAPNWEVRAVCVAPLDSPPDGTSPATLRRLAELSGTVPTAHFW